MNTKPFKILSIDGGGIRGVFPAMFLSQLESELKAKGAEKQQIHQHFDLICGTSTGGIIALALALGLPASEIYSLYLNHAKDIFGSKKGFFRSIFFSTHSRTKLEELLRAKFNNPADDSDYRLQDCKTNVCIPIYDLLNGNPSVCKNKYHHRFTRDYHIPAYKVALATSAAPTYFDPYSTIYTDLHGNTKPFNNKVDGGVFANNPALLGIIEAQEAFGQDISNLKVLSLGTGHQTFADGEKRSQWGLFYWVKKNGKKRIIDLFMQGQSQLAENLISLLQLGIDKERKANPSFVYDRITTELDNTLNIALDETRPEKLNSLAEKASFEFHNHANHILETYCDL